MNATKTLEGQDVGIDVEGARARIQTADLDDLRSFAEMLLGDLARTRRWLKEERDT